MSQHVPLHHCLSPQDDSSVSSEDMNGAEPTWVAAEQPAVPEPSPPNGERVSSQAAAIKEEDGMMIVCESLCMICVIQTFYFHFCLELDIFLMK